MKKVIIIGGSPMVGKSTLALKMATQIEMSCISTDDIVRVANYALKTEVNCGKNNYQYYKSNDINKIIEDTITTHINVEEIIKKLIRNHSCWGTPIIIEGWAIYPRLLKEISFDNVGHIFLTSTQQMLYERMEKNEYYKNAPRIVKEKYLERSMWHNEIIKNECKKYNANNFYVSYNDEVLDNLDYFFQLFKD